MAGRGQAIEGQGNYRIDLDRDWTLEDLYKFPRTFEQTYFFFASIDENLSEGDQERILRAYNAFPWQGGYSAVSFFDELKYSFDSRQRPKIVVIHKASPGLLELSLVVGVAYSLAKIVKSVAAAINSANDTYHNIYKGMQERKLLKLKVEHQTLELNKAHMVFVDSSSRTMAKLLGFSSPAQLNSITKSPYLSLKILLSVYRRVRTLAEYENNGKARLSETEIPIPPPIRRPRLRGTRVIKIPKRSK